MDWKRLSEVVSTAVVMLDCVIDDTTTPNPKVQRTMQNHRRLGLGVMGFANLLYLLEVPYDSQEGRRLGRSVMRMIQDKAVQTSRDLAKQRGPFPSLSREGTLAMKMWPQRNAALTNVAPCGTTGMVMDTPGGMEPVFALALRYRGVMGMSDDDAPSYRCNAILEHKLRKELPADCIPALLEEIEMTGSVQAVEGVSDEIKRVFVVSSDISPGAHVKMQAAFQRHCDNSISKTCNLANDATISDVKAVYQLAHILGCKGCTVYRDGSRTLQVLNAGHKVQVPTTTPPPHRENGTPSSPPRGGDEVIKRWRERREAVQLEEDGKRGLCPTCCTALNHTEGCLSCSTCSFSMCSL